MLQLIRQRFQFNIISVLSDQCPFQQIVADMRIFGQEWAVEVSGDHIFVDYALIAGLPGISKTEEYFAERCMISDIGAPAMVFKTYHRCVKQRAVQYNIADQPFRFPFCIDIQDFQPFDGLFFRFIIVSKKLVAAADSEYNAVVFYIFFKIMFNCF